MSLVDFRVALVSFVSIVVGGLAVLAAKGLLFLISAATNLAFYGRLSSEAVSPAGNHLGRLHETSDLETSIDWRFTRSGHRRKQK